MTAKRIPRVIRPRQEGGSDWNVDTIVVAMMGKKELRWWPGHTAWKCVGTSGYYPALLIAVDMAPFMERGVASWNDIHEGGRLSAALFQVDVRVRDAVNAFFGPEAADLIAANLKRNTTVVLT